MKNVQSAIQEERNRRFQPLNTALATGKLQKKQRVEQTVKKKESVADAIQKKQEELMQPESTALNG